MSNEFTQQTNQALNNFKAYFKDDLIGFLSKHRKNNEQPKFKAVVAGGYGLNVLFESKYGLIDKIKTKDLDITISTNKTKMTFNECFDYWLLKVSKFIQSQKRPHEFKVVFIVTGQYDIPVMGYSRYALIMITHKHQDFVDLVFTDQALPNSMFDKRESVKNGLPIKKITGYLEELLLLIYMENVSYVYPDLYDKRNPYEGWNSEKGKKDIDRANLVCGIVKKKTYKKYCSLIEHTALDKVASLGWAKRDEYFKALEGLVSMYKFLLKETIDMSEHKEINTVTINKENEGSDNSI
jgi:hypothetical protein